MTITNITPMPERTASRAAAGEIRAEMGRQGVSARELARRLGVSHTWLSRRIGVTGDVDITLEELLKMAEALRVSPQGFLSVLYTPSDSNREPAD